MTSRMQQHSSAQREGEIDGGREGIKLWLSRRPCSHIKPVAACIIVLAAALGLLQVLVCSRCNSDIKLYIPGSVLSELNI